MTSWNQKAGIKQQIKGTFPHQQQKYQSKANLAFFIEKIQNCRPSGAKKKHSWSTEEQIKYLVFVYYSSDILSDATPKDLWIAFRLMSKFLTTKNPNQCRIFHKQMMKKFESVQRMLKFIEEEAPEFSSIAQGYKRQLKMKTIQSKRQQNFQSKSNQKDKRRPLLQTLPNCQGQEVLSRQAVHLSTFQGLHETEKDEKQQNIRTDITFRESEVYVQNSRPSIDSGLFQAPLEAFRMNDTLNALNTFNNPNVMMAPIWTGFAMPPNTFAQSLMLTQIVKNQQEWQECHALYIAWTEKLKKLMNYQL